MARKGLASNPQVWAQQTRRREGSGEQAEMPTVFDPSSLLNQLGTSLPLPLLVTLYGANVGGYYTLVRRVLAVPVVMVGASIADAFHSRAA